MVAVTAEVMISQFGGSAVQADPLAANLTELPASVAGVHLEQQRQHMILMSVATKSFKVVGSPKTAVQPPPPATTTPASGGAPIVASSPPADPKSAQAIAYKMLPSFGFNAAQQFGCLNNIWTRESNWNYQAYNASGAFGIPQALPGSKMASAGADWQTNPATQIKWGLGYIKGRYGTPCDAWAFWQGHNWY